MNLPNSLTILRIVLAPIFLAVFMIDSFYMRLLGLGLFGLASVTDFIDGYLARKHGTITKLGRFLDPLADKILITCALISFVAMDLITVLPVLFIVAREFGITGLRTALAQKNVQIPSSKGGKFKTFVQMTTITLMMAYLCLLSGLERFGSKYLASVTFDYPFWFSVIVWLIAAITVYTGVAYLVKHSQSIRNALR